jgi:hypothetical protein
MEVKKMRKVDPKNKNRFIEVDVFDVLCVISSDKFDYQKSINTYLQHVGHKFMNGMCRSVKNISISILLSEMTMNTRLEIIQKKKQITMKSIIKTFMVMNSEDIDFSKM